MPGASCDPFFLQRLIFRSGIFLLYFCRYFFKQHKKKTDHYERNEPPPERHGVIHSFFSRSSLPDENIHLCYCKGIIEEMSSNAEPEAAGIIIQQPQHNTQAYPRQETIIRQVYNAAGVAAGPVELFCFIFHHSFRLLDRISATGRQD